MHDCNNRSLCLYADCSSAFGGAVAASISVTAGSDFRRSPSDNRRVSAGARKRLRRTPSAAKLQAFDYAIAVARRVPRSCRRRWRKKAARKAGRNREYHAALQARDTTMFLTAVSAGVIIFLFDRKLRNFLSNKKQPHESGCWKCNAEPNFKAPLGASRQSPL